MSDVEIGLRLRYLRNLWGFTQNQVAKYLGFNQSQIVKLEKGERTLKFSSLLKLCELYACDERFIVYGNGDYEMPKYVLKSNKKLVDLDSISNMNRIINNLKEMKHMLDNGEL